MGVAVSTGVAEWIGSRPMPVVPATLGATSGCLIRPVGLSLSEAALSTDAPSLIPELT